MRKSAVFSWLCCCTVLAHAQTDSLFLPKSFTKGWHIKTQFAGSIGFASIGVGRSGKKLEADLWYGYVPKSLGGVAIHTATAKLTWFPVKPTHIQSVAVRPLGIGSFISYTPGSQYFLFNPEQYPFSYYGYPTALHIGLFAGGQASLQPKLKRGRDLWALYYEVGTTDIKLVSYFTNTKSLSVTDLFTLGFGIKRNF